eukprot:Platyproteum_vivax@DN186_c0_g1_i1.p1
MNSRGLIQLPRAHLCPGIFASCRFLAYQTPVDRAVREIPYESRFDIFKQRKKPVYMDECVGTPRQEYQENVIDGIRVKPTFNPYVKMTRAKRYTLDRWESRNWDKWSPDKCFVRGSRRQYNIPQDILPYRDELGEMHPPKLSGRYRADVEKQYAINSLPWVWKKDFYTGTKHFQDHPPKAKTIDFRTAIKKQKIKEAIAKMDDITYNYRQEYAAKKKYNWLERNTHGLVGESIARDFMRKQQIPKL